MVEKAIRVNQGDLLADRDGVHGRASRRAVVSRSQSAHSSAEAPKREWSEGSAGRWIGNEQTRGRKTGGSA
jgi:hypothetical protein